LDYATDIALFTNTTEQANKMLHAMEIECRKVRLIINAKKIQVMAENKVNIKVTTVNGSILEVVNDFKYFGTWMASSDKRH
jgi:hypothetical protein